jgi:hypothetical protein
MKIIKILSIFIFPLMAMQQDAPPAYEKLRNLDDVPNYCAIQARLLDAQPVVRGVVWGRVKRFEFDPQDARLLYDFTQATRCYIKPSLLWRLSGPYNGTGLELSAELGNVPCSIETLLEGYRAVVKGVKENWMKASAQERSRVSLRPEEPADWELFIQANGALTGADKLIRTFMYFDPLSDKIKCYDRWDESLLFGPTYIWIKKGAFDEVQARLGLSISQL